VRIGITWTSDDAEPQSVLVLRVVPDSPADRAGIKIDDRIYQVGHKSFSSTDEFDHLLTNETSPLELAVESRGQIRRIKLERN
ncbi:MAG TPA: PDZ domain-containing protein, partial [Pirellulales bacterium]|nr:PDZ domain-containing protein [Pirellulales bacterium]